MASSEIVFVNRAGLPIRADLHRPDREAPWPLVLVAHGFKGFKDWGFFPYLADALAGAGLAALRLNFARNGIGDDPQEFTRLDLFEENSVSREIEDLTDVTDKLSEQPELEGCRTDRFGVLGHSRGGAVAILFAAKEPRVISLVTLAAVADFGRHFPDVVLEQWRREGRFEVTNARTGQRMALGREFLRDLTERKEILSVEVAARSLGTPLLVIHGGADASVPLEDAHRIARAAGPADLLVIPGAGHTFEAVHPFAGPTPALDQVARASSRHFLAAWTES